MEIFSFSKGFRLYKLLIKCESLLLLTLTFVLLLNKPTISEAYKSTGLTVWSNISCGTVALMVLGQFSDICGYGPQISENWPRTIKGYGSAASQIYA